MTDSDLTVANDDTVDSFFTDTVGAPCSVLDFSSDLGRVDFASY
jgi:hypothetical protein